jgi:hypothetical protein
MPKAPAPVPADGGRIHACLKLSADERAGAGYTIVFSISGVEKETGPTDASGCANLDFSIDVAAKFAPVSAKDRTGASVAVAKIPAVRIYRGETKQLDVAAQR